MITLDFIYTSRLTPMLFTADLQGKIGSDYADTLSVIDSSRPPNVNISNVPVKGTTNDNIFSKSELLVLTPGGDSGKNTFGTNLVLISGILRQKH